MSVGLPVINCPIMKQLDGSYLTYIMKDGITVDKIPTPPSQIRRERTPCLWSPEIKDSTSFIQQTKAFIGALEEA